MMVDWGAVAFGSAIGAGASAVFFAGLGLGMRLALRAKRPVAVLMLSSLLRILAMLAVGWVVVSAAGPSAFAGFALAFFVVRKVATTIARTGVPAGETT